MFSSSPDKPDAQGLRIGIAVSRYHHEVTDSMRDAAIEAFVRSGGVKEHLTVTPTLGSFDLTAVCQAMATASGDDDEPAFDAIVALGCIIAGETEHNEYIGHAVAQGLTAITVKTGVPIAFGVLTCENLKQAWLRSMDAPAKGGLNKGAEAMLAAIQTANAVRTIHKAGIAR